MFSVENQDNNKQNKEIEAFSDEADKVLTEYD
jgi:hypothetical protein